MKLGDLSKTGWSIHNVKRGARELGGGLVGYALLAALANSDKISKKIVPKKVDEKINRTVWMDLLKVILFLGMIGGFAYYVFNL